MRWWTIVLRCEVDCGQGLTQTGGSDGESTYQEVKAAVRQVPQ